MIRAPGCPVLWRVRGWGLGVALAWLLGAPSAQAQVNVRCNESPAGSQQTYRSGGLTSLARTEPRQVERAALPRIWLDLGFNLLRMPYQWGAVTARAHVVPFSWFSLEGGFSYGLPAQRDLGARQGSWAEGRAGVRLWHREGEAPWRFVLAACRTTYYTPSPWETRGLGNVPVGGLPEPTRLDYVLVDVPVEHGVWLDGGVRWGWLAYRVCPGGDCAKLDVNTPVSAAAVRTFAAGPRYARFIAARLDGAPLRATFEVWAYALFRPMGLPNVPLRVDGPILPDSDPHARTQLGVEVGMRYTPWSFEWAQIEAAAGYTPAAGDLLIRLGLSFPIWLL